MSSLRRDVSEYDGATARDGVRPDVERAAAAPAADGSQTRVSERQQAGQRPCDGVTAVRTLPRDPHIECRETRV
jgi:hypothetical protein